MKVLLFDTVADRYGSSRICRLILDTLRSTGHSVTAHVGENRLPAAQAYADEYPFPMLVFAKLRSRPFRYLCELAGKAWNFRRRPAAGWREARLVYCNTFGTLPAALLSRWAGKRVVVHLHETPQGPVIRLLGRTLLKLAAHRVIFVSGAIARAWGLADDPSSRIVHNGLPALDLPLAAEREYDIVFVGRLTEKKGFPVLLDALARLEALGHPLRVAIAGATLNGAPLPPSWEAVAAQRHVRVDMLGEVDEGALLFYRGKVACVPSVYADPFPTVILEGLRAGCALVASAVGGANESLADTQGNALIPPEDAAALADALAQAVATWSLDRIGRANRSHFEQRFGLDGFQARLLKALDKELAASDAASA
ncbi:glycosyltransferase family 4 protein [Roseateles sp.]|uniref:glycosyltransferase family 4 protein n=1 Tax=Roseateles sp. TaxID=1971397 RepID=UPI0031D1EA5E